MRVVQSSIWVVKKVPKTKRAMTTMRAKVATRAIPLRFTIHLLGGGQGLEVGHEDLLGEGVAGPALGAGEGLSGDSKLALIHRGHEYAWGPLEEGYWFPLL
ncbi:hypothetical protein TthAA22_13060 [Thermus thermophilus]|nr:hypothetical protein TthAA22_13060 [Thermus thermophilus]